MPDWQAHIRPLLAPLRLSPARKAEIAEELTQHLEDRWRELVALGATPAEAAHAARTEFDGARLGALLGTLRQAHRHETPVPGPPRAFSFDSILLDLRHSIRSLRATPSFTLSAFLVLALGTGATTAIFSVVDAVALRPLPFPDPNRIVALGVRGDAAVGDAGGPKRGLAARRPTALPGATPSDPDVLMRTEPQDYLDWVTQQHVFESIAAVDDTGDYVLQRPGGEAETVTGHRVTASFFDVLQAGPLLGEVFTTDSELGGSDHVVLLSYGFWQRHFGNDPTAVGRMLALNGESYRIVGVMPASFGFPPGAAQPAQLWVPWIPTPQERVRSATGRHIYLECVARLRTGISISQAQAQMSQVASTIASANVGTSSGRGIGIRSLRDHLVGSTTRSWMSMLLGAVGMVLLIACANVANLWLARASVQHRDVAVRAALGASRSRLVQRAVIESLVVSAGAGTFVGLALAWLGVRALAAALPESLERVAAIGIDMRVLAFAAVASLATGLVSGVAPALQGSRPALSTVLSESTRGGGTGAGRRRARAVLVVVEVALAVVLLVAAALFIGSFVKVMRVDPGFRSDGILTAQIIPPNSYGGAPDMRPAFADVVDRARSLFGVIDAAAAAPGIPLRAAMWIDQLRVPGQSIDPNNADVSVKLVTADYHRTLGISLRRGRYFSDDDRAGAEAVVILSEAAGRVFFASENPLGRSVVVDGGQPRVVGVVANARQSSLEVSPYPEVYLPMAQSPGPPAGYVLLRTQGDPNAALPALRAVVAQVLPQVPLRNITRLDDLVVTQVAERRLNMQMFALFGLLGLVIAAVGIFGVITYLVSQQTRDIGIRMALGATQSRVIAGVFSQVGRLLAAGLIFGGLVAWSLSNMASGFLFGLDPRDGRAYAVAIVTLLGAALVATVLPARRAASISPISALREE